MRCALRGSGVEASYVRVKNEVALGPVSHASVYGVVSDMFSL